MMRGKMRATLASLATFVLVGLGISVTGGSAQAVPALNAYVSQPFVQGSSATGVEIETFDTNCPTTWWDGGTNEGTLTGTCYSSDGNIYGGANSTSGSPSFASGDPQTKFGAAYSGTFTVTLQQPASYMGFWWSAGDYSNTITLFSGGTEVATFNTQNLMEMLYYDNVGSWSADDYFYNPANGAWVGEPFAYIHLVGIDGFTFDSFRVDGGNFEFDNFTIVDTPVTLDPETVTPIGEETPPDADGDGVNDVTEDTDGDGIADPFEDRNGDNVPDVLQDTDGDGTNDFVESVQLAQTGVTTQVLPISALTLVIIAVGASLLVYRRRA